MRIKNILLLWLLSSYAVSAAPPIVAELKPYDRKAECYKRDKAGSCIVYKISSKSNSPRILLKVQAKSFLEGSKYTILVVTSRVGFVEPVRIALYKAVSTSELKKGIKEVFLINKDLRLKRCDNFPDRILVTPFIINRPLSKNEIDLYLKASKYCVAVSRNSSKKVCSYNSFYSYIAKKGWAVNDLQKDFIVVCANSD